MVAPSKRRSSGASLPSAASSACSRGSTSREYPVASTAPCASTITAPTENAVVDGGQRCASSIARCRYSQSWSVVGSLIGRLRRNSRIGRHREIAQSAQPGRIALEPTIIASTRALDARSHFLPSSNLPVSQGGRTIDDRGLGGRAAARRRRAEGRVRRGLLRVCEPSKHLQIEDFDRTTPTTLAHDIPFVPAPPKHHLNDAD